MSLRLCNFTGAAASPPPRLPCCKRCAALATARGSPGSPCSAGCVRNASPEKPPSLRWWTRRQWAMSSRCPGIPPDGDHDGQPEDLPDVDPPTLADDQPATARVVCMLDVMALVDADADRLHVRHGA